MPLPKSALKYRECMWDSFSFQVACWNRNVLFCSIFSPHLIIMKSLATLQRFPKQQSGQMWWTGDKGVWGELCNPPVILVGNPAFCKIHSEIPILQEYLHITGSTLKKYKVREWGFFPKYLKRMCKSADLFHGENKLYIKTKQKKAVAQQLQ